jgi:crossover junction endodeoxyribonuclease RusA
MKLEFPWFDKILNPNEKAHWAKKAQARREQKKTAYFIAKEGGEIEEQDKYLLQIIFHPPDKRGRDLDNCMAAIKGVFDGLAIAWRVNDKDFRFDGVDFGDVVENGKIIIELKENQPIKKG